MTAALRIAREAGALLTPDDFQDMLSAGEATMWRGGASAVFLRRVAYERSGEVIMEAGPASGDLQEILSVVPQLEAWAREECGCTQVHVHAGRGGWERALKRMGYEVFQVVLRKQL